MTGREQRQIDLNDYWKQVYLKMQETSKNKRKPYFGKQYQMQVFGN